MVLAWFRQRMGENNLSQKTLIDPHFLVWSFSSPHNLPHHINKYGRCAWLYIVSYPTEWLLLLDLSHHQLLISFVEVTGSHRPIDISNKVCVFKCNGQLVSIPRCSWFTIGQRWAAPPLSSSYPSLGHRRGRPDVSNWIDQLYKWLSFIRSELTTNVNYLTYWYSPSEYVIETWGTIYRSERIISGIGVNSRCGYNSRISILKPWRVDYIAKLQRHICHLYMTL